MKFTYNRFKYKRKKRTTKKGATIGLATNPQMMSKNLRLRRYNQTDTKTFWFKLNGTVAINNQPYQYFEWRNQTLYNGNPNGWIELTRLYDQYKILGFTYKLFPSNVGTEPTAAGGPGLGTIHFNRGNHCLWLDQRFDPNVTQPTSISQVICTASARLINPRRPYELSIWRPKGKYIWGSTRDIINAGDNWTGSIQHFIEGATPSTAPSGKAVYYYTLQYKVIFRGRQDD